ncbi:MAG: VCBS repeat-containing protein [Pirellulaceae bacterium]
MKTGFCTLITFGLLLVSLPGLHAEPWKRHTIDGSSRGADGVRLADVNGDGLQDMVTGWEEGGVVRLYLNPGPKRSQRPWPAVTVGKVKSPEDAVFADLDGDGSHDVISCCEGRVRSVFIHWAPKDPRQYLAADAWSTTPIPAVQGKQMWMYCLPMQIDGQHGVDLLVGAKGSGATVGWLQAPRDPRKVAGWRFHSLYKAGWIMSLESLDVDHDGDQDVVVSDRKGARPGVLWLENPGPAASAAGKSWPEHRIGGDGLEVMFLAVADLDQDGHTDVVTSTRNKKLLFFRRQSVDPIRWQSYAIANPHDVPWGKAVAVADINGDGRLDLVHATNTGGKRSAPGLVWMSYRQKVTESRWQAHDISGLEGVKFDLIQVLDLDGDQDLDVISCEERDNLGVFWYENPLNTPAR